MKKAIILLIIAVVFFGTIVACEKAASNETVMLNILTYGDNSAGGESNVMDEILNAFKAENPNIEINEERLFDDAYHQKLQARLQSGDVPHLLYAWDSPRSASLYLSGQAVNLEDHMKLSAYNRGVVKSKSPMKDIPKGVYVIPLSLGINSVMFVNTALLESIGAGIPKTYDDIVAMLPAIKEKGLTAVSMANAAQWVMNSTLFGTITARVTGSPIWMSEAMDGKHKFTDAPFVDSLKFIEKMYTDGVLDKKSVSVDYGSSLGLFMQGKAVFMIDGHWRLSAVEEDAALFENVELIPFPMLPNESASVKTASAGSPTPGYTISQAALENEATKKASLMLLEFITNKESSLMWAEKASLLPIRNNIDISSLNKAGLSKKQAFYASVKTLADTPDQVLSSKINEVLNSGLQEIGLGAKTPEEVAQAMEQAR